MDCKQCIEWIDLAIDEELDVQEERFLQHLSICPECKKEYEDTKYILQTIRMLPDMEVPDGLRNRWKSAIQEERNSRKISPWWRKRGMHIFMGLAAAAILFLMNPLAMLNRSDDVAFRDAPVMDSAVMEEAVQEPEDALLKEGVVKPEDDQTMGIMAAEPSDPLMEACDSAFGLASFENDIDITYCLNVTQQEALESFLKDQQLAYSLITDLDNKTTTLSFVMTPSQYEALSEWLIQQGSLLMAEDRAMEASDLIEVQILLVEE